MARPTKVLLLLGLLVALWGAEAHKSLDVQRAIASVLIRADYQALARSDVLRVLTRYRMKSPDGRDIIDILIRRLQMSES
jgi:hypothetical protein